MSNELNMSIFTKEGESEDQTLARTLLDPVKSAAVTIARLDPPTFKGLDLRYLAEALERSVGEVLRSDKLEHAQEVLAAQAITLDGIFHILVAKAAHSEINVPTSIAHMKLALKAQSQCRTTLEALNAIRNPKLASVVNQANIAGGHQQVNNQVEKEIPPNELSEEEDERMDSRAEKTAVRKDSGVEALGAVHGAKNGRRKAKVVA